MCQESGTKGKCKMGMKAALERITGKQTEGTRKPRVCPGCDHTNAWIRGQDGIKNLPVDPL